MLASAVEERYRKGYKIGDPIAKLTEEGCKVAIFIDGAASEQGKGGGVWNPATKEMRANLQQRESTPRESWLRKCGEGRAPDIHSSCLAWIPCQFPTDGPQRLKFVPGSDLVGLCQPGDVIFFTTLRSVIRCSGAEAAAGLVSAVLQFSPSFEQAGPVLAV